MSVLIFLIVLFIIITAVLVIEFISFKNFQSGISFTLTFNQFQKFYAIAPHNYFAEDSFLSYLGERNYRIGMKTFLDYLRYKFWYKTCERIKKEQKSDQNLQNYITEVRQDLKRFTVEGN